MTSTVKRRWPMPANWPAAADPDLRPAADEGGAGNTDNAGPVHRRAAGAGVLDGSRYGARSFPAARWNSMQFTLIRQYWRDPDGSQVSRGLGEIPPDQARRLSVCLAAEVRAELRFWVGC